MRDLNRALSRIWLITLLTGLILAPATIRAHPPDETQPPVQERELIQATQRYEMVLIHGIGGAASTWNEIAPFLKGTFEVGTFELTGHGQTQPILDPTIDKEVARLTAYLNDNDFEYPTLVGHGLGGLIALRYCLDNPARAHRLILIDTAPKQLATDEQKQETIKALAEDYDRFVASRFLRMSPRDDVTDIILDQALKTDSASFISLLLSSFDFDVTPELNALSVPMLVIGSEMLFPAPETCQDILGQIGFGSARSLSFKRVEGAGHYIMLEKPVYLASVLMAFGVTADHIFEPGY